MHKFSTPRIDVFKRLIFNLRNAVDKSHRNYYYSFCYKFKSMWSVRGKTQSRAQ